MQILGDDSLAVENLGNYYNDYAQPKINFHFELHIYGSDFLVSLTWFVFLVQCLIFVFMKFQRSGACDFFEWYDPVMSNRAQNIIVGLLRRIERNEGRNNRRHTYIKMIAVMGVGFVLGKLCSWIIWWRFRWLWAMFFRNFVADLDVKVVHLFRCSSSLRLMKKIGIVLDVLICNLLKFLLECLWM